MLSYKRISNKIFKFVKKDSMIDTTITIETSELKKHMQEHFSRNRIFDLLTGISAISGGGILGYNSWKALIDIMKVPLSWKIDYFTDILKGTVGAAMVILGMVACIYVVKRPSTSKIINAIVGTLYKTKEYTAIILMKTRVNGIPAILVRRQESWRSYFLPYCHFNPSDSEEAIIEGIKHELSHTLELPEHIFIVENPYNKNQFYRIKKNLSSGSVSLIQFRFYSVRLQNGINRIRFTKTHYSQFSWKSKTELSEDIGTMSNNGDVLSIIDEQSMIQKTPFTFSDDPLRLRETERSFRIIWTITNHCSYECSICATNSSCRTKCSLTFEQKQKILLNIASINQNIESLDISGGDPLLDPKDQELIRQCYHVLPFTNISITTTAAGLDRVPASDMSSTVKCCDITYDIPCQKYEQIDDVNRIKSRPYNYNKANLEKLIAIRESGLDLEINIHVPIHNETINFDDVQLLLEDIARVHPKSVKFIRLMPVGRLEPTEIPKEYAPKEFLGYVDRLMKEKHYDFSVSINCALKTEEKIFQDNVARRCPMLNEKLGIDSEGNVFACMWAAYLRGYNTVEDNPFYLGNLLEKPLYEIVRNPYLPIENLRKAYEKGCPVCCVSEKISDIRHP